MKAKKEDAPSNGQHNILAVGTIVKGDITTEGDFRLDGRIEGNINCTAKIVIGSRGYIEGNIVSANAEILGTVAGNIHTRETLVLKASSVITGDIYTQILEIEPGAKFSGVCTMLPASETNAE